MIGAFARMLGSRDRILTLEETGANTYDLRTRTAEGDATHSGSDAPPEAFSERIPHEGGDVWVVPVLETLRRVLKARATRGRSEDATLPDVSEKP